VEGSQLFVVPVSLFLVYTSQSKFLILSPHVFDFILCKSELTLCFCWMVLVLLLVEAFIRL